MTLKEIEKIIDKADYYWFKCGGDHVSAVITSKETKEQVKSTVKSYIEKGGIYIFFKLNNKGEVKDWWVVYQ